MARQLDIGVIINFNELFKDRIIKNANGEKGVYKPSYVVWVENDTEEQRKKPEWEKNREKNSKWIQTKRAAAQLGVPIVIIDREYFAKRELKKTELMKKLITGEKIDEDKYGEFVPDYEKLTKPDIVKKLFTTIENNRTGMLNRFQSFFSKDYCTKIRTAILGATYTMDKTDAIEFLYALIEVSEKERYSASCGITSGIKRSMVDFYKDTIKIAQNRLNDLGINNVISENSSKISKINVDLLKTYLFSGVSTDDVHQNFIEQDYTQSAKSMQEGEK